MTYERNFDLINSKFKELLIPTLISSIAGNFAILVDAFFISIFMGSMFLSVVQTMEPFVSFINVIYWLIGFGGSILCTVARAEFDKQKGDEIFSVSIIGIIIIALIITLLSFFFQDTIIQFLCHSDNLKQYVVQYFNLYIIGIVSNCFMTVLAYFIRTDGFVQLQFRVFLVCNVINMIFDVVLMKFLNMEITGAALATTLGTIIAALYIMIYFFKSSRTLKIIKVKSSKIPDYIKNICKTGFSTASIPLYIMLKLLILNAIVSMVLGEMGLVALNMCYNTGFLVEIFILGTTQSILPITAVYFKEGDYNGVSYVIKQSMKLVVGFGIFFTALFCIFPQIILFLFNVNNPADIPIAMNAIRIFSFSFLSFAINYLYIFYAQSIEENKLANILTLLQGFIFPVMFTYICSHFWGGNGFWMGLVLCEVATLIFLFIYSRYINKKTNGEYSGFFINKSNDGNVFEFSFEGNVENAVNLSKQVQEYLSNEKLSALVAMAIEDMVVYIIDINENIDLIDLIVRNSDDSIIISIKYSGKPINPTINDDPESSISILKNISDDIEYSEILGLNNTLITINKK